MRHGTKQAPSLTTVDEGKDPLDRSRPRLPAIPEVENEAWVAHDFAAEAGWGYVTDAEEILHLAKQMHS